MTLPSFEVKQAYLLADASKTALAITHQGDQWTLALPAKCPDPIATAVVLEVTPTMKK